MPGWQELRRDLARIREDQPRALLGLPDPDGPGPEAPVSVVLAAWAEHLAADLHATYGGYVDLTLGAFGYPGLTAHHPLQPSLPTTTASDLGLTVDPVVPLAVRSGDSTRTNVTVSNSGSVTRELHTSGQLSAYIVDERGRVVGGYVGAVHTPLVRISLEPTKSTQVPVLLGASSLRPEVGYAIPPGTWQAVVVLPTADGAATSKALPVAITT